MLTGRAKAYSSSYPEAVIHRSTNRARRRATSFQPKRVTNYATPPASLCVFLSLSLSVCLSVCLFVCLSVCVWSHASQSVCVCVSLFVCGLSVQSVTLRSKGPPTKPLQVTSSVILRRTITPAHCWLNCPRSNENYSDSQPSSSQSSIYSKKQLYLSLCDFHFTCGFFWVKPSFHRDPT